ncbi:MAG: helix-turn-helix transcriptional regulator [Bacteroidaceae bacterium]
MKKIPEHKATKKIPEGIALWHIQGSDHGPAVNYVHRDDYYMLFLLEEGEATVLIDFKEYKIFAPAVFFFLPGQVHQPINHKEISGWGLVVDSMLVANEYKELFKTSIYKPFVPLEENVLHDLRVCVSLLQRRINADNRLTDQGVIHSLATAYIGMIGEIYQKNVPVSMHKRPGVITVQFNSLLVANYQTMKTPSQYASRLNISPSYLNEVIKRTTGLTASECIQNEIMVHAKRLLFHTNMSVKEIALELGYEDWAYFTRLFTKASSLSPTQFRKKHLK